MAFRIPFNEHMTIEVDTAEEVRALIAEFGVALSGVSAGIAPPKSDERTNERTKQVPCSERRAGIAHQHGP